MVRKYVSYASSRHRGFYGLCNAPVAVSDPQWPMWFQPTDIIKQFTKTESNIPFKKNQ